MPTTKTLSKVLQAKIDRAREALHRETRSFIGGPYGMALENEFEALDQLESGELSYGYYLECLRKYMDGSIEYATETQKKSSMLVLTAMLTAGHPDEEITEVRDLFTL